MTASSNRLARPAIALVGTLVFVLLPVAVSAQIDAWAEARRASTAMEWSDYPTALEILAALEAELEDHPAIDYVRGKYLYHQGHYDEAVVTLDRAIAEGADFRFVTSLRSLVAETSDVVRDYALYVSDDGLFEIRYDASRDGVLIPYAAETLEAAYYELGYDLGYWPEPPIRVEIYPRASVLAQVSSLTSEAIETSGTIALCKYNKLMFTSPRATARGYTWRDTISHEYVHYVVQHLVRRDLPIWFHEALAKYLEQRWTGSRDMRLAPSRESLLSRRIEANDLVTFEQMHPSMAYLPSPEDASTAYAQVFTLMEYVVSRRGVGGIREILYRVRDGAELEEAFAATMGERFEVFLRSWEAYLRGRPRVSLPGDFDTEVALIPERMEDGGVDTYAGVDSVEARDFLRIGELLRARGMVEASIEEYRKAEVLIGRANPVLQNALARAYLDVDRVDDALDAVDRVRRWYPDYYRSHVHRGEALNRLGQHEDALEALRAALGINPFDPSVHEQMLLAYEALGREEEAARARADAASVRR